MGNKIRRIFNPTPEEMEEDYQKLLRLHNELKVERGCETCKHCKHVISYPGFVTAEECECDAGLQCDTVLFRVKNCKEWVEDKPERWK